MQNRYGIFVQIYPNGDLRLMRKELDKTHKSKEYTESDKEYHKRATRRCRHKKQFESEKWMFKITLTVGDESLSTNPKELLSKAKKFLSAFGVKYWLVAQTHEKKSKDGLWRWHIHGVVTAQIDLNVWCELTGSEIKAQRIETVNPARLDEWFFYISSQLWKDMERTTHHITKTNCKSQKLCKSKTVMYEDEDSEILSALSELKDNQTLRGQDAAMLKKELEKIKKDKAEKNKNTSNVFAGEIAKMLTTSRILYCAREGGIVNLNDYAFEGGGAPIGRRHNRKIPVFWGAAYA